MNRSRIFSRIGIMLAALLISGSFIFCGKKSTEPGVVVTVPFAKVYNSLNPDSGFSLVQKGEKFELEHDGKKWYRVWVKGERIGFISKEEAKLEGQEGINLDFPELFGIVIVLLLCVLGMIWLMGVLQRKKPSDG